MLYQLSYIRRWDVSTQFGRGGKARLCGYPHSICGGEPNRGELPGTRMPVTPLHFGPGLLFHAASRRCSMLAFMAANVFIDFESAAHLMAHTYPIHTFFHTFLGATLMIFPAAVAAWVAGRLGLRMKLLPAALPWSAAFIGAGVGAWSHVVFDSIMHTDVQPFAPWSTASPLHACVSLPVLFYGCLLTGLAGAILLARRRDRQ